MNLISTLGIPCHRLRLSNCSTHPLSSHGHRSSDYNQTSYYNEFGVVVDAINNDAKITKHGNLVAPSTQGTWSLQSVWDTGFLTTYQDAVSILAVEQ